MYKSTVVVVSAEYAGSTFDLPPETSKSGGQLMRRDLSGQKLRLADAAWPVQRLP